MEERLRRMERYMGLGSLAAGLQHEIKNPLNALSLHIQLLCERLQKDSCDEEVNEMLEVLHLEVKRIGVVLDGFRNYASIHQIGRAPVDVKLLLEKLIRLLRPDAEQKNVQLEAVLPSSVSGVIQADAAQLEQVFLNLALKRNCCHDRRWNLEISNRGTGRQIANRYQRYRHWHSARIPIANLRSLLHDQTRRIGMGLALCDKIVRQHDGSIDFQTSSKGTTFSVLLPTSHP